MDDSSIWLPITFPMMFQSGLEKDGDIWESCNISGGDSLPTDIMDYHGVVITGSRYNCRDRDGFPWFDSLCEFIRKAAEQGSPRIYGGCFGCQLIGFALGGEVDYNPNQRFILKAEDVCINREVVCCAGDSVNTDTNSCFVSDDVIPNDFKNRWLEKGSYNIIVSHGDCVCKLPPSAKLLASSVSCRSEVFIAGKNDNIIACQSHPELDYQYAVADRIWKVVVDQRKRLNEEELQIATESFAKYNGEDAKAFMNWISDFLHVGY